MPTTLSFGAFRGRVRSELGTSIESSVNSSRRDIIFVLLISPSSLLPSQPLTDQCYAQRLVERAFVQSVIPVKPMCLPCLLSQRPPRTRSKDVFPVPVFPVISRLFPSVILRFRSLISTFSEEGAERETCSRRNAVSLETTCSLETLVLKSESNPEKKK